MIPEVGEALAKWLRAASPSGVLIGGLAVSYYVRPRSTTDVDMLFLSELDIPEEVAGFKHHRKGAFEEKKHQVEIETVTPLSIGLPQQVADRVVQTAELVNGLKIATVEGLVALKLYGLRSAKRRRRDEDDILNLLRAHTVDMSGWPLDHSAKADLARLSAELASEKET